MLDLVSQPILRRIVGCRVMPDSVSHRLKFFNSVL
jgi:hypothetical protein